MTTKKPGKLPALRIGIDIGGTFTDFVIYRPNGEIETFKVLSTPVDPAQAVLQGLSRIWVEESDASKNAHIIHGSTVATNALLERKGAHTALITTRGFRDVLQIGRQDRPALYDFSADPAPPLVPGSLRFGVDERVDYQGQVLQALDPAQVETLIPVLRSANVSSIAVCLLFSFLHPEHEAQIAECLRSAGFLVSASSEVLPEYREYERTSTTTVNAYVSPILDHYLSHLAEGLERAGAKSSLRVMQSNGGNISLDEARHFGVRCILSGPAGGVVGARFVSELAQIDALNGAEDHPDINVITFDMGGTSTDVSLIEGKPQVTTEAVVGGCPIRIPILDIHTIGAGGGSIAYIDPGGALRVGPESAGADPGPACYGKGESPTVTDANLVLGRLAPEHFLGGQMLLDSARAQDALARLGARIDLDPTQAALGVVAVANAHMERALRVISVERGHDPRRFALLSFGGAGGLHAADLARRLGIPRVLVPPLASTLSAFGMLAADVVKDYTQTVMFPGDTPVNQVSQRLDPLAERGIREIKAEGILPQDIHIERFLDMRYQGQSYELTLPFSERVFEEFHKQHNQVYGYNRPEAHLEIVNLRVRASGKVTAPGLSANPRTSIDPSPALLEYREVVFETVNQSLPFYRGEALLPGNHISGPALVVRADTTILIGPADSADVDGYGNLMISITN
jgi:N-methylhydantoinase A